MQLSVVKDLSEAVRAQIVLNIAGRVDSQGNWAGGGCLELAMTDPGKCATARFQCSIYCCCCCCH